MEEVSSTYSVPIETIKKFEKEGFFDDMKEMDGKKIFEDQDLKKLSFMLTLQSIGFSMLEIRTFLDYMIQGEATMDLRINMLKKQRNIWLEKVHANYKFIDTIDYLIYQIKKKEEEI